MYKGWPYMLWPGGIGSKTTSALNNSHILSAHYLPDQWLSSFLLLFCKILTTNLQSKHCHLSFTDEDTGALRGKNDLTRIKHMVCSTARIQLQRRHRKLMSQHSQLYTTREERGTGGGGCKNVGEILPVVKLTYLFIS